MRPENTENVLARLIVCERTGKWAVAFRRAPRIGSLRVYETRSREECRDEVQCSPASLVAIEATTANLDQVLDWLVQMRRDFPLCRVVVLGTRGLQGSQWLLREAGAAHTVCSPRHIDAVVKLAWRHFAATAAEDHSIRGLVWGRMPW